MSKVKPCKDGVEVSQPQFHTAYAESLRKIICVKCGQPYIYRGEEDDEALALGIGICTNCKREMTGE